MALRVEMENEGAEIPPLQEGVQWERKLLSRAGAYPRAAFCGAARRQVSDVGKDRWARVEFNYLREKLRGDNAILGTASAC